MITKVENEDGFIVDGKLQVQEKFYRSTILAFLRGCGVMVTPETHTSLGRSDLVVAHRGVTWVIEIKIAYAGDNPKGKAKEAIRQIAKTCTLYEVRSKNYAELYPDAICIGLAIDDTQRQITEFEV